MRKILTLMRKILLILLSFLALTSYGQAEFEKISITENVATAATSKIVSQQPGTGELNYIDAVNLPLSNPTKDYVDANATLEAVTDNGNTTENRIIISDGTVDLSTIETTTSPAILSTKPKYLLARSTDLSTAVSEHGFADNSIFNSNNTATAYNSFDAFININGTLAKDHYLGYQQRSIYNGSGTLDFYQGYRDAPKFTNGTVQRRFGFRISDVTLSGSAVVERNIGLKIEAITGGTVYNKPIESDGTATSTFAGGITSALALEGNTIVKTGATSSDLLAGNGSTFSTNSIYQLRGSYGGAGESLNDLITSGIWLLSTSSTGTKPLFTPRNIQVIRSTSSAAFITQIAHHTSTGRTASRNSIDSGATWSAWLEFANADTQTFTTSITSPTVNISGATASTIALFDTSKNIVSASTGTYPSLTELAYVKGATSSIQTQINTLSSADAANVKLTGNQTIAGVKSFTSSGAVQSAGINVSTSSIGGTDGGVTIANSGNGYGLYFSNSSGGSGIYGLVTSGTGIRVDNSGSTRAIYSNVLSTGDGIVSNVQSGTGLNYVGQNNGAVTFTVNKTGDATANTVTLNSVLKLKAYTVGTLPAGTVGDMAYVTDATAPTYNGILTGGGAVKIPVFYDGAAWKAH